MLGWWLFLFVLSAMTFVDTFFGVGTTFREMTSAGLLLAMLGLLTRIARKTRAGERKELTARVAHLEGELEAAQREHSPRPKNPQIHERVPTEV